MRAISCLAVGFLALALTGCTASPQSSDSGLDDLGGMEPDTGSDPGADAGTDAGGDPSTGDSDQGDPGSSDGDAGGDPADSGLSWDGGPRPDFDPAQTTLLIVPPGVSLCSTFCECRGWQQELGMRGRLDLAPGTLLLTRGAGTATAEMVAAVWFGPQAVPSAPTGEAGTIETTYSSADYWIFTFKKAFTVLDQPYGVQVDVALYGPGGAFPAEVVADAETAGSWITGRAALGPGQEMIDELQAFSACPSLPAPGRRLGAATASGVEVQLDLVMGRACQVSGNTSCWMLGGAQVWIAGQSQKIADPFRLVYSASHHNYLENFLVILDAPAQGTAALLLAGPESPGEQAWVISLDTALVELGREPATTWEETWQ
jgi:hypothetical protein